MTWLDCSALGPCLAMQVTLHETALADPTAEFDPACPHCGGELRLAVPLAVKRPVDLFTEGPAAV